MALPRHLGIIHVSIHVRTSRCGYLPHEKVISFIPPAQRHRFHYVHLDYSELRSVPMGMPA